MPAYLSSPTISLTFTKQIEVWQFPNDRFTNFDQSDESWCRFFGIGREVTRMQTITFPKCVVTGMDERGGVEFVAIPSDGASAAITVDAHPGGG